MTPIEIEKSLAEIVMERERIVDEKLKVLDKSAKTEKKALMIEKGMYSLCVHAGLLYNTIGERDHCIQIKSTRMLNHMKLSPNVKEVFEKADQEEKLRMTAALYGELWMTDQFVVTYRSQLAKAKESGETALCFELKIKLEALESALDDWKNWRHQNGIYADLV